MNFVIIPVSTEQVPALATLANTIWHECFTTILSQEQIDYMVARFQSESAMSQQINELGYRYFFLQEGNEAVGYMGIQTTEGKLFLSKLYLKKAYRGKGYASQAFHFLESLCKKEQLSSIWLTVNRHNNQAIEVYQHRGFQLIRAQVTDIGQGFVMDDFVLEKPID